MKWSDDCCAMGLVGTSRAEARRMKVIDVARNLFTNHGFHSTGVAQISRESGVAVGQIYRDFASKEEIVAEIVHRDCASFLNGGALREAMARHDESAVRAWIAHIVSPDDRENDGGLIAEIIAESARNVRIAEIFRSIQQDFRANVLAALCVFAPGVGAAPRRAVLADTIMTLSIGLLHHRLSRRDEDLSGLAAALNRIVEREIDDLSRST